jgi:capsular polysaccharide export protein
MNINNAAADFVRPLCLSDLPHYKNILLLQGPLGCFFKRLAVYWQKRGSIVTKINFTAGDDFFYKENAIQYKGTLKDWSDFLKKLLEQEKFDAIFLFGDCRPIHQPVKPLAQSLGIDLWVLEEGYFRPNYFTLEREGVNYFSSLTHLDLNSLDEKILVTKIKSYPRNFWAMVIYTIIYGYSILFKPHEYPHHTYHRSFIFPHRRVWIKAFFRYWKYRISEYKIRQKILKGMAKHYFLVPLQIEDDYQIRQHSDYQNIEQFIDEVLISFAKHCHKQSDLKEDKDVLIFNHHPMNRGHINYKNFIFKRAKELNIETGVVYLHDLKLPAILPKTKGCITINSTFGLQALSYKVPVITFGRCFYNKPGLTYQGNLDSFWHNPGVVDTALFEKYKAHVIATTQVNGCLYSREYEIE